MRTLWPRDGKQYKPRSHHQKGAQLSLKPYAVILQSSRFNCLLLCLQGKANKQARQKCCTKVLALVTMWDSAFYSVNINVFPATQNKQPGTLVSTTAPLFTSGFRVPQPHLSGCVMKGCFSAVPLGFPTPQKQCSNLNPMSTSLTSGGPLQSYTCTISDHLLIQSPVWETRFQTDSKTADSP